MKMFSLKNNTATLFSTIQSHNDLVNSIDFCVKNERTYVIIASSDCSVSLNDLHGTQIGIFGQEVHWKMEHNLSARQSPSHHHHHNARSKSQTSHPVKSGAKLNINSLAVPSIHVNSNLAEDGALKTDTVQETVTQSLDDQSEVLLPFEYLDSDCCFLPGLEKKLSVEQTFKYESDAFIKDTSLRYNPWSKTILGSNHLNI